MGSETSPGDCPDADRLAAYFDDRLTEVASRSIRSHLADCTSCSSQLAILSRLETSDRSITTPDLTLARALKLGAHVQPYPANDWVHGRKWTAFAVACSLVLMVGFIVTERSSFAPVEPAPETRLSSPAIPVPRILSPSRGNAAGRDSLEIEWTPISGALYYDVYIISKSGDLVSRVRVDATRWAPGVVSAIEPGREYYARVDAYLSDSRKLSSGHVLFTLTGAD